MKQDSTFAANLKAQRRDTAYARLINPKEPGERDLDSPPGSPHLNSREHSEDEAEGENPNPPRPSKASVEINKRPPIFQSFPDYVASDISVHAPANSTPWKAFRTRLDFEVAEFCELAMLNTEMTETLITFIRRCGNNIKNFTIANHSELNKLWGWLPTNFVEDTIAVPYKEENRTYKTYTRPIWDWVLSLVQDPRLASCFSALPNHPDAKALGLIVYADKSKLSTFGTEKPYAVVARVANILVPIRNSTQFGGGQVVGHQPVVKDDTQENNKPAMRTELSGAQHKYIEACKGTEYGDKSWNFPKMHSHQHVFEDIKNKGATRNFGTKISESMHGPIRQTYHRLTNFKNVTPQLIKHDHRRAVGLFIREQLEVLDAPGDSECPADQETDILSNISIGSKLKSITFAMIEDTNSGDAAFARFRVRFADFLSNFLQAYGYNLPDGKHIRFEQNNTLVPFQFLKVHYEHLGNWTSSADYLRCNPSFHGHSRYDGALFKTTDGHIFVQLIYMFSCTVEKKSHPFGLVLPLDTRAIGRKDRLLRFHRVHAKPRKNAEFISVHSIIRGVLLAPDFDNYGEFFIVDIVDTDISLRLKDMYPDRY
ncbi:hypothetical protein C8R44DRAFT_747072 [Mycena epipterygia]|nr:hypothetical protein C8R44DRAFT_747072 [Mycena epipterygia]